MDKELSELVEAINFIKDRMATKDDLLHVASKDDIGSTKDDIASLRDEVQQGFASVHSEVRDIRTRLDQIDAEIRDHGGFAKEVDHLIQRVSAVEKHLGIQRKIAA